ncbi:MAG: glucose/sorbosone dehydrogenase domain protein, partial [Pedosphaera sp.]|nr:glucose/sorbosone dehydrogenase domain protein [Pedosphaera sp.]
MGLNALAVGPYGLEVRPPVGAFLNGALPRVAPGPSGAWTTVNAFPNLTFQDPAFLVGEPGTNRLYVCGREGYIWFFTNNPNTATKTLFLDLHAHTQGWDDCGLLGMAFHPEFGQAGSTNRGYIYVCYQYTANVQGSAVTRPDHTIPSYNRLSRFTVPTGSLVADPNSELVLINQFDRDLWHDGGAMFFGPDGFLYFTNGDEGYGDNHFSNAQKINGGLFSGVFRIDVNKDPVKSHPIRRQPVDAAAPPTGWANSSTANYFTPNDNPFVNPDGSVLEEFYAIGFRSPHRMTYDGVSGRIWLGDVGQSVREEVDVIVKGGNYQWSYMEGIVSGPGAKPSPYLGIEKGPVYDYPHANSDACIISGYVYRGSQWSADLGGKLLFGDNVSGRIWTLAYDGVTPPTVTYLCNMPPGANYDGGLSSFGVDQNNEIYMCAMGASGQIFKLARTGVSQPEPPALLSQVGVFTNMVSLAAAGALLPYDVNSPLWSDGAVKSRWIAMPTNTQIGFAPTGEWSFPAGTVLVKHFELPVNDTDPTVRKRLETRLLVRDTNGMAYGVTYKWRADNSDADLLTNSLSEDIVIASTNGTTRTQTWYYPSRQDCLTCHNPNANFVLGVKTRQQNGNYAYASSGITDNQLRTWNHLGLFSPALNEANIPTYAALVNITNTAAGLTNRMRSYLDANCANCHRPNGTSANWDARYDTPLASQGIINGPVNNDLGIYGSAVFTPGDPANSVMYQRINTNGTFRMPPLARNVIDGTAVSVLAAWINSFNIPQPWTQQDVGSVGHPGDASYDGVIFTVRGSGVDIANTADSFHFVYQPMTGDGQIVAHVLSVGAVDNGARSGVMFRESLAGNSKNEFMSLAAASGAILGNRSTTGGSTFSSTATSVTPPYWVKLVRSGNSYSGYISANGLNWTFIQTDNYAMATNLYAGLAVHAHDNTAINTSTFDNVTCLQAISTQPQSQSAAAGSDVTFTVGISGTPSVNYQWRFNGTNIVGATNSNYTRAGVQLGDAGNYSVVATNLAGSVISSNAVLTVTLSSAISINTQPQSQAAIVGSNVTFTVAANSGSPLGYQWQFNAQKINGATNASCTITNVQPADGGNYSVVISNAVVVVTSSNALLTVNIPPLISTQPQSLTLTQGTAAVFSVAVSGTAPFSYQWRFNGSSLASATNSSYTRTNAQPADAGNYSVAVTNIAGGVISSNAALVVNVPPGIAIPPQSLAVSQGSNATFTVTATGTASLSYQWQFNSGNIAGATNSSYTRTNVQPADAGGYRVMVTNIAGSVTSVAAPLAVNIPPLITTQPQSLTLTQGTTAVFGIVASGTAPLSYQWQFNNANIAGATGTNYTRTNVQPADAGNFSVVVTNIAGVVTSSNAALVVNVPPRIANPPQSLALIQGSNATFTVTATGTAPLTYQWQ